MGGALIEMCLDEFDAAQESLGRIVMSDFVGAPIVAAHGATSAVVDRRSLVGTRPEVLTALAHR